MFNCFITVLSTIFYNSLICLSFVIEIFYFQTVPGTKHHRFILYLTFYNMPSFFRHQKDSGSWSIYKGENLFNVSCILVGMEATTLWNNCARQLPYTTLHLNKLTNVKHAVQIILLQKQNTIKFASVVFTDLLNFMFLSALDAS